MSEASGYFVTPPTPGPNKDYSINSVYEIGQIVALSWVKDFPSGTLSLTQDNNLGDQTGGPTRNIIQNTDLSQYDWVVSYMGLDPGVQNVFSLGFGDGTQGFGSHYFNITGDEEGVPASTPFPTSTVTSVTTMTTTSTFSRPASLNTTTPAFTFPTSTGSPSAASLTAGGIAGIAVGVTLGAILVAGALGFFGWNLRNRRAAPGKPTYGASHYAYPQTLIAVEQPREPMSVPVAELEGSPKSLHIWRHEMPA
ncbi:hypothetical protein F4823DRAFT_290056 [Ustulina deusta]|nr:hypothetical protein F4823DRAFT_290056 [Ustulina deusta]